MVNIEEKQAAERKLLLPLRGQTVFPGMVTHFDVGRPKSVKALELAMARREEVFLVAQRDIKVEDPGKEDLYAIGTVAKIKQILKIHSDVFRVLVEGVCRAQLVDIVSSTPYYTAEVVMLPPDEPVKPTKRDEAMIRNLQEELLKNTPSWRPKCTAMCWPGCWKAKTWPFCAIMWPSTPA